MLVWKTLKREQMIIKMTDTDNICQEKKEEVATPALKIASIHRWRLKDNITKSKEKRIIATRKKHKQHKDQ